MKDGFITGSFGGLLDGSYTMAGKAFNDIFKFRFCCRELKVGGDELNEASWGPVLPLLGPSVATALSYSDTQHVHI